MSETAVIEATVVDTTTGEIVPFDQGQVRLSLADLEKRSADIVEAMKTTLLENTHYGRIPGTPKPTLLKAGAEWLLRYCGYGVALTGKDVERDADGVRVGVSYTAQVFVPTPDGGRQVVAECEAYAGHDESKWKSAPWNTVMKMAQKRAIVGAVLIATGASSIFTQDVEDYESAVQEKQQKAEDRKAKADPEFFRKRFHAVLGELGVGDDAKRAWLRKFYQIESTNDLDEGQRAALLALLARDGGKERLLAAITTAYQQEAAEAEGAADA